MCHLIFSNLLRSGSEDQLEKEFSIDNAQLSDDAASPESGHEVIFSAQVHRNWQAEIMAHLAKFKRYPRMSRLKKEEGIVMIRFVVDREGRVLESSLVENRRSNASAALKKEARNVIRRAAPLPVPPTEISGDAIELIVPIVFSLSRKIY